MLRKKTFQNKVAASRYALPVTATLAALVWVAVGFLVANIWVQFAFTILSTLLMVELNNHNSLMRTYSRMVSCSFLVFITMTSLPTPSFKASIVTMCSIAFYLIIWNSYQDRRAAGWTFYAFFCVGLASMVFIQVGYFLPFLWLMMMVFTNSFSIRNFFASIIGLIMPYWFSAGYFAYTNNIDGLISHFAEFINYHDLFDYSQVTDHEVVNLLFLIILQPQHIKELSSIMIVNTAPLTAHFITYTKGKLANIVFISALVIMVLILLYNIFIPEMVLLQAIQG